jgi:uncharacterized protein YjcR
MTAADPKPNVAKQAIVGMSIAGSRRQETVSHARGAAGSGAPKENKNALKHGVFTKEAIKERKQVQALIGETRKLLRDIE